MNGKVRVRVFLIDPFYKFFCFLFFGGGGDGGSFLACEDFVRMFDNSFPACALLFIYLFIEKWRLGRTN